MPAPPSPNHPFSNKQQEEANELVDKSSGDGSVTIESASEPTINPPPNGGYGWVCTAATAVINMHSWGFTAAYSVFLAHYLETDSIPGATALEYAFVGGLSLTSLFLISPIATISVGKYGIRPTMLAGVLLETASMICASFASKIWHLFLTQGVLFGLGLGLLFIPTAAVIPQWFSSKRSLANGVALAGAAFGGMVYSLATGAMIKNIGFHWALRILGILAFVVNTSSIFLIQDRNEATGCIHAAFNTKHFMLVGYWFLIAFGGLTMLGYFILIFTLADFADQLGFDSSQAAVVSAMFNLGQTIGRPLVGYFSDSAGRINMAASMTFLAGVLPLAVWVNTKTYSVLIAFALLEGAVAGTFWATIAPLMVEVVGMKEVSSGLAPLWLSLAIPCTFSEAIALTIVKQSRSYLGTQLLTGLTYIAAAICVFFLRAWKINQLKIRHAHRTLQIQDGQGRTSASVLQNVPIRSFLKFLSQSCEIAKV